MTFPMEDYSTDNIVTCKKNVTNNIGVTVHSCSQQTDTYLNYF